MILGADIMVGAAFQPRFILPVQKRFAAGKPPPQKLFKQTLKSRLGFKQFNRINRYLQKL
jgi:hypothetical protein